MKITSVFFIGILRMLAQQGSPVLFEHISLDDGLSQSTVTSIVQDSKGFMWYGTEDGLNKYDGYTFTVYRHSANDTLSLAHSYISTLYYSKRTNVLWVGTQNGVLHSFNPTYGTFTRHNNKTGDQQTHGVLSILTITEDFEGNIWFGTFHELSVYHPVRKILRSVSSALFTDSTVRSGIITELMTDSKGRVWVGSSGHVSMFDCSTKKFSHFTIPYEQGYYSSNGDIFLELKDGTVLVGSNIGVHKVDIPGRNLVRFPFHFPNKLNPSAEFPTVMSLVLDSAGRIWAGTFDGLFRFNGKNFSVEQFIHEPKNDKSLSENSVLSLFVDRTGVVHIGTYHGVNTYAPWQVKFTSFHSISDDPSSLVWDNVRSFAEGPDGNVWIGTMRGISFFNLQTYTFSRFQFPRESGGNIIWSLRWDDQHKNTFVAGLNGGGVKKFAVSNGTPPRLSKLMQRLDGGTVFTMVTDSSGNLWTGQIADGITVFDIKMNVVVRLKNNSLYPDLLANNTVVSLAQGSNGIMWAGTDNGLTSIQTGTWKTKHYRHDPLNNNSPSGNNILCLYLDPSGILWFGTYAGLNRMNPVMETFTRITMENGLPNDVVYAILPDTKGNLWFSTNKGIVRYTPESGAIKTFTPADGLQSNEFNQRAALLTRNGTMFFGGVNGFTMFHPDRIIDNRNTPAVVLTDVKVFNKSLRPSKSETRLLQNISDARELHLEYSDAVLTFEFAALEYTNPEKNQYAYMMEGFNTDWVYAGTKREATYTNLDPGEYTFRVKASNNDDVWNEEGTSIKIFIAPPWWMTWWFRSLLLAAFLSVGPFIYYRRVSGLKKEFALQQEFSKRLIESQEGERKRIASELHDGLGQDLLVVKNRAFIALRQKRINSKIKEQLIHIQSTATDALANVRSISRNLRPYHLEKMGLQEAVKFMIDGLKGTTDVHFILEWNTIAGVLSNEQEINLFRIVQEAVNNIVKHSQATVATIRLERLEEKIVLSIHDDGKGFSMETSESVRKGFGLSGIGERVRILAATYSINSSPGKGTTVRVEVPVKKV
ncbi:MAG: two-component regulator propeller domain-containing protein [Bacteroidota bacterium]